VRNLFKKTNQKFMGQQKVVSQREAVRNLLGAHFDGSHLRVLLYLLYQPGSAAGVALQYLQRVSLSSQIVLRL
jgi:hypothetical protein